MGLVFLTILCMVFAMISFSNKIDTCNERAIIKEKSDWVLSVRAPLDVYTRVQEWLDDPANKDEIERHVREVLLEATGLEIPYVKAWKTTTDITPHDVSEQIYLAEMGKTDTWDTAQAAEIHVLNPITGKPEMKHLTEYGVDARRGYLFWLTKTMRANGADIKLGKDYRGRQAWRPKSFDLRWDEYMHQKKKLPVINYGDYEDVYCKDKE